MNELDKDLAKKLYGVFEMLRDSEQFSDSGTHKLLQEKDVDVFRKRAEEEFTELEDCIKGTHRHSDDFREDFLLESSQVFYWLALTVVVEQKSFEEFLVKSSTELSKLEKLHEENNIPIKEIFEKDLKECEEKGYLSGDS